MNAPAADTYLLFRVETASYSLPIVDVIEILGDRRTERMPGSSRLVRGVFNHAGTIVPVIDVRAKFGLDAAEDSSAKCVVLVAAKGGSATLTVGLQVDGVEDVVSSANLEPAPAFGSGIRLDYLRGLLRHPNGLSIVLDADRFLSAEELTEVSAAAETSPESISEIA